MPTLPNMGLITPTLGGDPGVWDDKINAMCGIVDAHDHTAGKGVRITPAAININADLAFGGNGATGLGKAAFTAVTALTSGATTLFVNTADGELYWRTAGGTNVKLTAGNSINTSLVGGIVGDYTAVSAQVYYDDAGGRYKFLQKSPGLGWAVLASGEVRIYETGTTETVYVGQKAPTALAASYAVTWPLALPAAAALVQVDASGVMTFGNTIASPILFTGFVDTIVIPGIAAQCPAGTATRSTGSDFWNLGTSTDYVIFPITLSVGFQIASWSLGLYKQTNNTKTITSDLMDETGTGVGATVVTVGVQQTNATNAPGDTTIGQSGLSQTITAAHRYYVRVAGSGTTGDQVGALTITVKRVS